MTGRWTGFLGATLVALSVVLAPGLTRAQQGSTPSPILTVDQERLFAESLWGKRVVKRIEAASSELSAENRRIEAELTSEEKSLTDRRAKMPTDEFRAAAEAFDKRVTEIRKSQDAKARAIGQIHDSERQRFYAKALPAMGEVLSARGAVAVLDSRAIFVAADQIDITDELIAHIDEVLGPGTDMPLPDDGAPEAPPPASDD